MFLPWIEAEFEMSQSAAYRFINVAEQYSGKLLTVGSLSPKALYELAAPSTPPEAREEIERRVAAGEIVSAARSPARRGAFERGSGLGVRLGGSRGTIMDRRARPARRNLHAIHVIHRMEPDQKREIVENLRRAELTALERATQVARWSSLSRAVIYITSCMPRDVVSGTE